MPLPLGHAAVGLATYETIARKNGSESRLKVLIFIVILANLPDLDILAGLLWEGNASLFHRGPSHSFLFALVMGFLVSQAGKIFSHLPRLSFVTCAGLILSHVIADMLFTSAPVSLLWPIEVNWSHGSMGWGDVVDTVLFENLQDGSIIIGCFIYMLVHRGLKRYITAITSLIGFKKSGFANQ